MTKEKLNFAEVSAMIQQAETERRITPEQAEKYLKQLARIDRHELARIYRSTSNQKNRRRNANSTITRYHLSQTIPQPSTRSKRITNMVKQSIQQRH